MGPSNRGHFLDTPVTVHNQTFFIVAGSYDLAPDSERIPCRNRPKPIYKKDGLWRTANASATVQTVSWILPFNPHTSPIVFKAPHIYQSEINEIISSMSLITKYNSRINRIERILKNQITINEEEENVISKISNSIRNNLENMTDPSTFFPSSPLTKIKTFFAEWQETVQLAIYIAIPVVIIVALVYTYPFWAPVLFFLLRLRRLLTRRRVIAHVVEVEPSAPHEDFFMLTYVPPVYQISASV